MMKLTFIFALPTMALSLLSFANLSSGIELDTDKALHDWQVRRLMEPSPSELETERKGSVYIYDGLTDREVETALDAHFGRIQYMMFVGTVKTGKAAEPSQHDDPGQPIQESSGCNE
jgi:hypothetical protein